MHSNIYFIWILFLFIFEDDKKENKPKKKEIENWNK